MKQKNVIILIASFAFFAISFWLSNIYEYRYDSKLNEYKRDFINLESISKLNTKYRTKAENSSQLEQLITSMGITNSVSFSKVNNNIAEYKIEKLNQASFDRFVKEFMNKNFKVQELKIERVDNLTSNISFKVEL